MVHPNALQTPDHSLVSLAFLPAKTHEVKRVRRMPKCGANEQNLAEASEYPCWGLCFDDDADDDDGDHVIMMMIMMMMMMMMVMMNIRWWLQYDDSARFIG